ncbi:MAG TPA: type 4a pilus biogenesis protein PilO, partial [Longimicrobium sp.]|nr:type 4a pilus biogenesis protein PilO [Longimicrobium sp.]
MALPPLDAQQRKNLIYGSVLLLVAAFGYYNWVYSPRGKRIDELQARLDTLQVANAAARAKTRGPEGDIETTLALYRKQLEVVEGLIPSSEELPDLLDAISSQAQQTGVEMTLIQPVGATDEPFYTRRVYDLAVRGRYHDIGEFLTRVASLPRVVTPLNLSL